MTSEGVSDPPRRRSDRRLDRLSGNSGLGVRKRSDRLSEITGMRILAVLVFGMLWLNTRGWAFAITVVLVLLFGFLCYEEGEDSRRSWRRR